MWKYVSESIFSENDVAVFVKNENRSAFCTFMKDFFREKVEKVVRQREREKVAVKR